MRLKGNDISPLGQLCGICDVFDAMTSDRSYHKAMSRDKVIAYLISEKGKHFNPDLVDLFVKNQAYFVSCGSRCEICTTA
jgi:HD-GYP domain-containing protein (c-di-GMP phosphodiesterase class II)